MRNLDQLLNATRQGTTPAIRANTALVNVQKQYHMAAQAGPNVLAEWERTFTQGIPDIADAIAGAAEVSTGSAAQQTGG